VLSYSIGKNQSFSDDYILGAQVGEGSLAVVYQATRKVGATSRWAICYTWRSTYNMLCFFPQRDGEEVAVKVIQKNKLYPDEVRVCWHS
jgi:serine/threonine protein kinase